MSSRAEAASHGNYMPLVTALSPSALTVAVEKKKKKKANSLCVIFVMIHPSVHTDAALSRPHAHKHWPPCSHSNPPTALLNLKAQMRPCTCSSVSQTSGSISPPSEF